MTGGESELMALGLHAPCMTMQLPMSSAWPMIQGSPDVFLIIGLNHAGSTVITQALACMGENGSSN